MNRMKVGKVLLGLAVLCQAVLFWLHLQSVDQLISLFHVEPSSSLTASGVAVRRLHACQWSLRIVALHCVFISMFIVDRRIRPLAVMVFILLTLVAASWWFLEALAHNLDKSH